MNNNSKSGSRSVTVTIKVQSEDIKSFRDPNQLGRKRFVLQVPVEEIAKASIEFGPNPRNQDMGTRVVEAIEDTLLSRPAWFQYANKGILINAQEAEYDNKVGELRLELERDSKNPWGDSLGGNMDGGHTQAVIIDKIKNDLWENFEDPKEKQWVNVEVLTGIQFVEELTFIAGARNTSVSVKDLSLAVLNDELDWLISEFEKEGVNQRIAWRQFAPDRDITGEEVLAYLSLLNPEITDKTRCYVGAGSLIKGLRSGGSQPTPMMLGLKTAIGGKAVKWMRLIDYLHNSMETWWKEYKGDQGEGAKFGRLCGVQLSKKNPHPLVFLRRTQNYRVAKSWLMPIAYGFTIAFQQEKDENFIFKLADTVGPKLMGNIYDITESEKLNLNAVGKNKSAWTSSLALVDAAYMRSKFEQLSGQRRG